MIGNESILLARSNLHGKYIVLLYIKIKSQNTAN